MSQPQPPNPTQPHIPLPHEERPLSLADFQEGGSGCRTCLWGLGGAGFFLVLSVLLCVGLLFGAGRSFNDFLSEFGNFFRVDLSAWGGPAPIDTSGIVIPQIERVQALSTLTTVRYNYARVVTTQQQMPALLDRLYGQSQVLLAIGHIEAGIDLSNLTPDDLVVDAANNTITLQLPAPALQDCFLNDQETRLVERNTGIFAADSTLLDNASRQFALSGFRELALEEGILDEAAENATITIQEFVAAFAPDATIRITVAPPNPAAPLPDTCG